MSNSENNKRIAKNTLMLYIRMLLSIVVSLYTSRVVLEVLGVEDYGIYGVVGGVVAMFSFLNASMSGATSRFLTFEMGKGDMQRLKDTFSSAMVIHIGIALIVFILAETIGLWFLCNKLVIPEGRMEAAHWVYQCSILSAMLTIIQAPYNASIISNEKMDVYAYLELLNVVLKLAIVFLLNVIGVDKLIVYASLMLLVSFLTMIVYRIYCLKKFSECSFHLKWNLEFIRPMITFIGWDVFGHFSFTARQQGANFLINMFYGVVLNAACGIAFTIQGVLLQLSSNVVTAFRPAIIKEYASGRYKEFNALLNVAAKMSMILLMAISVAIYVKVDYVIEFWLGQVPEGTIVISRIMILMNFFASLGSIIMIGVHASGQVVRSSITNGAGYLMTIPMMYVVLLFGWGYSWCYTIFVLGTILYCIFNLYYLKKQIPQFNLKHFVIKTLLSLVLVFIIANFITLHFSNLLSDDICGLLVCFFLSFIIVIVTSFILVLDSNERMYVYSQLMLKFSS